MQVMFTYIVIVLIVSLFYYNVLNKLSKLAFAFLKVIEILTEKHILNYKDLNAILKKLKL